MAVRAQKGFSRSAAMLLLLSVLAVMPGQALAHSYQGGSLHIVHPSSRATAPGAPNGVGYLRIEHKGEQADRWLAVESPRADRVELHQSLEREGMRSMQHVALPLELAPGQVLELRPGGYHLMLMGLDEPLEEGEQVPLNLSFEHAGDIVVELHVEALGGSVDRAPREQPHPGH